MSINILIIRELRKNIISNEFFLLSALLIYALFGLPFPKSPGLPEISVGILMLIYVGLKNCISLFDFKYNESKLVWPPKYLDHVFLLLLIMPMFLFLYYQWELSDLIRDLIPLVFLFSLLFIGKSIFSSKNKNAKSILVWGISIIGLIFSVRFYNASGLNIYNVGFHFVSDGQKYYPYDPAVLFSGIFLVNSGIRLIVKNIKNSLYLVIGGVAICLGVFCLSTLISIVQRAPVAMALLCFCTYLLFGISLKKKIFSMIIFIILASLMFKQFSEQFVSSVELFISKHYLIGASGKLLEWQVILTQLNQSLLTSMFGLGWGGLYENPLYGGRAVSVTHSVFSYMLIKTGIIGFLLFLVYVLWVINYVFKNLINIVSDPGKLAALGSIIIGVFFQPNYKVLTFGLLIIVLTYPVKSQYNSYGSGL